MPRRARPPYLYLRERAGRSPQWVIRDGQRERGTGCPREDYPAAQEQLAQYLADKYTPPRSNDLTKIAIADVLNLYLQQHGPTVRRPDFLIATAAPLATWWVGKTLADVRAQPCRDYVAWRTQSVSTATARHDLKTLRAAINYWHKERGPLPSVPAITLPQKPPPRLRWLTRKEVAALLRAARAKRWRHVARFILLGYYTGTRSGAILALKWTPSIVGGWIDLEAGVLYRRGEREAETAKRRPPIRIPDRLLPHLRRWQAMDEAAGHANVISWNGAPVAKLRRSWAHVRQAAGLGADVVPHTLRHSAATRLLQEGVSVHEAAGYLGMSATMLDEVYGHHSPHHQKMASRTGMRK